MASGAANGIGGGAAVDADAGVLQSGPEDADGIVGVGGKVVEVIGALATAIKLGEVQVRFSVGTAKMEEFQPRRARRTRRSLFETYRYGRRASVISVSSVVKSQTSWVFTP